MYNDKYIGDFSEEMYLKYLSSPKELKQIAPIVHKTIY